jgi:phosphatidylglycerophosphatase C
VAHRYVIAAFDFDETLITVDTLPDFIRYVTPLTSFILKSIAFLPTLISFQLHRTSNQDAKQKFLKLFIGKIPLPRFKELCETYANRLDTLANPVALERLAWHQSRNHEVVIISASLEDWIKPWAKRHKVSHVIATQMKHSGQVPTGTLAGKNCHSAEKVRRFVAVYPEREDYELYMYGDGKSDQAMFEFADHAFEKRFQ